MDNQLTINDLYARCEDLIKLGYGDRKIVVPTGNDDEYVGLNYGFSICQGDEMGIQMGLRNSDTNLENLAVLE